MLNKIKALLFSASATLIALLLMIITHLRASNAKLDKELQRRELERLKAQADALKQRSKKMAQAQSKAQKARAQVEAQIRNEKRDYFEQD